MENKPAISLVPTLKGRLGKALCGITPFIRGESREAGGTGSPLFLQGGPEMP